MSKEMESRFPGVIARLMGLDSMSSSHAAPKQQKETTNFQKRPTRGFQEKYATDKDHSLWMSSNEHQEFKDVFEVFEMSKIGKHKNHKSWKGTSNLRDNETDKALAKQKFMDVKQFPTDETFHSYNCLNDAREALNYDKDFFLKFLHEPKFTKHIYELKCTPPSRHASHITILKPSEGIKRETREVCCPGRNDESYTHIQMDEAHSYRKSVTTYGSHSFREHSCYLPDKFSELQNVRKMDAYHDPCRIVILKPSIGKASNVAGTLPPARSHESHQFDCRRNIHTTGSYELHLDGKDWRKFSSEYAMQYKTKRSREIAKKFSKKVRHTANSVSRKSPGSKSSWYIMHSCVGSGMTSLSSDHEDQPISIQLNNCSNSFGASSSYSTKASVNKVSKKELSVNREARKQLSKQWKMAQRLQEAELVSIGSTTLGEMFAESDNDTQETADPLIVSNTRLAKDEALATQGYRCGISSKNGWENRYFINLPNPKSYPAPLTDDGYRDPIIGSSVGYVLKDPHMDLNDSLIGQSCSLGSSSVRTLKYHNKERRFYYSSKADRLHEREIHVNSEELRNRTRMGRIAYEKQVIPKTSEYARGNRAYRVEDPSVSMLIKKHMTSTMLENELIKKPVTLTMLEKELTKKPVTSPMLEKNGESTCFNQENRAKKESRIQYPQVDRLPAYCNFSEYVSPISSSEAKQPSPVSRLEPPSEEEKSSSRCFQKINADLQELQMQLQRFKFDSADEDAENLRVLIPNDQETDAFQFEILEKFRNKEERDFSYLLDVLIESDAQYMLFDTCYSVEYPVAADVFEKLEKRYSLLVSWSKTERKQLFDLVNETLVSCILTKMDPRPLVKPSRILRPVFNRESFVEELWQMVVRQRKELIGDSVEKLLEASWLNLESDVDMMGKEIERMIEKDLLEELASELILSG